MLTKKYLDCEAQWDEKHLTIRNSYIERSWEIVNGLCFNTSLMARSSGKEYLIKTSSNPSPAPEFNVEEKCKGIMIEAMELQTIVVENIFLQVSIKAEYNSYQITTKFKIYPQSSGISSSIEINGRIPEFKGFNEDLSLFGDGVERNEYIQKVESEEKLDINEEYHLNHIHQKLGCVNLMDHTDNKDNLVHICEDLLTISSHMEYQGNLFYTEEQLTGEGLIFLKEAPLPHARPCKSYKDLVIKGGKFIFCGLGAGEEIERISYPFTTLVYSGGRTGRIKALQDYQRNFRKFNPDKDLIVWYSIWGDRNRDGKICESYMLEDVDRLEELGLDFMYFIDGWQKGASSNSVVPGGKWSNQWDEKDYWSIHPARFPKGIETIVENAKQKGIQTGAWYNPDQKEDYRNWDKDTEILLEKYHKYGMTYFKFDGVAFYTKKGEKNLIDAMHKIVEKSGGNASIEMDITAGVRTGYFSAMQYGYLFLENRYTDWRKYYPHCTLRNLWKLSEFVDPRRVRMEFLNNERNLHLYSEDPLAPVHYTSDYLFAITMFAKPMAWLEIANLPEEYKNRLKQIIHIYKEHRERIMLGNILPIGDEPSGFSWTGFQSQVIGKKDGYALVFRELNTETYQKFKLSFLSPGSYRFTCLSGRGSDFEIPIGETGCVEFSLPDKLSYSFYKYERVD